MPKASRVGELKIRAFDAEERLAKAEATIRQLRAQNNALKRRCDGKREAAEQTYALVTELRQNALLVGGFMTNVVDALLDLQAAKFQTSESADYIAKVINEATRLNARETTT